jgi:curved DNA-binding protein CbpA
MKDPYDTLGVPKNASKAEIKRAYKKAAQRAHPDRNGGNEDRFKELNAAHALLSDNGRREHYNRFGESGVSDERNRALQEVAGLFIMGAENLPEGQNIKDMIVSQVEQGIAQRHSQISAFRSKIANLERAMKRVKKKTPGPNLVHQFFEAQILNNKNNIAAKEKELERAKLMLEIIADYEYVIEPQRAPIGLGYRAAVFNWQR